MCTSLRKRNWTGRTINFREQASDHWKYELVDDLPIRGTRLLSGIYQQSNVAVHEPAGHDEALQDKKWRNAMEQEMLMINKNKT